MSYAGDVEPSEAYAALERDPRAVLVDVRTRPELCLLYTSDAADDFAVV